jgi:hypothetical protein
MMAALIHEHSARVKGPEGTVYRAKIVGEPRRDGTWSGWIEFVPSAGAGQTYRTDQETSQPDRSALDYWAGGLEPIYLDGAFERARRRAD